MSLKSIIVLENIFIWFFYTTSYRSSQKKVYHQSLPEGHLHCKLDFRSSSILQTIPENSFLLSFSFSTLTWNHLFFSFSTPLVFKLYITVSQTLVIIYRVISMVHPSTFIWKPTDISSASTSIFNSLITVFLQ